MTFSDIKSFVCEKRNPRTGIGMVVIYDRQKGFKSPGDERYIVSCETHQVFTSRKTLAEAKAAMQAVDFCEDCQEMPIASRTDVKGMEMIIALQSMVGIQESEADAMAAWRSLDDFQRRDTINAYQLYFETLAN